MRTSWLAPLALFGVVACSPPAEERFPARAPVASPGPAAPGAAKPLAVAGAPPAPPCVRPPPPGVPNAAERAAALEALLGGRSRDAAKGFERVVRARPRDLAASFLHNAASASLAQATSDAGQELGSVRPLPALPLEYRLVKPVAVPSGPAVRVEKASEAKNLITDDADWFKKNDLPIPFARPAGTELPPHVANAVRGIRPSKLFHHADHDVAVYGSVVAIFAPDRQPVALDLAAAMRTAMGRPMDIDYAQLVGRSLVVQLAFNGYAREAGNKNGFVAAFDVDQRQLAWCSEPLVANASSFVVAGGQVVTGYGFTAEPDFVFVLDLATGRTLQKIAVASGPSVLVRKGERLFVRTYDMDYVFRLVPGSASAPPATLAPRSATGRPGLDGEARCHVDAGVAAIDARDVGALGRAVDGMRAAVVDEVIVSAFEGALRFLESRARGEHTIDLTTRDVTMVAPPPWDAWVAEGRAQKPAPKAPRLVRRAAAAADPVRNMRRTPPPGGPFAIAPVDRGRLPPGARADIPSSFGFEDLRAVIPSGDRLLLVYGGRYLAVVRGDTTEQIFDLDGFRHPPRANPQWKEFAEQDVTFALVAGGVVFVANGGGSYAREVFGKKGFMSAIDLATGKLLWRSQPLVSNASFGLWRDWIVTGYGFTDEPDYVFLLRQSTGEVGARVPVDSGPDEITVRGDGVHVETYGHVYDFDIVP